MPRRSWIKNLNSPLINNKKNYRTAVQLITSSTWENPTLGNVHSADKRKQFFLLPRPVSRNLSYQVREHYFDDYCFSIKDIFYNTHFTTFIKFTNKNKRCSDSTLKHRQHRSYLAMTLFILSVVFDFSLRLSPASFATL